MKNRVLYLYLAFLFTWQAFAHGFWLPISTHSGQTTIPWLMNQGKVLFDDILEQHAPGSSLLAALAQRLLPNAPLDDLVRGLDTLLALVLSMLVVRAAIMLGGLRAAVIAMSFWILWLPVFGNVMFYFNTLVGLSMLSAFNVGCNKWTDMSVARALLIGFLMGLATFFKQQAWLGVILLALVWGWQGAGWRRLMVYFLGALVVPSLVVLAVAAQGNLDSYFYWNWAFNLSGQMDGVFPSVDFVRKLGLACIFVLPFVFQMLQSRENRTNKLILLTFLISGLTFLFPRAGEIQVTSGLPFMAVISGVCLAQSLPNLQSNFAQRIDSLSPGLLGGIALLSMWSGLVAYVPNPLGISATLGYDEFWPVVKVLTSHREAGDTLFVLPEADSTPQIHPMSGMLPPGTWIKGWRWYIENTGMAERLLEEWKNQPPTFIVVFPELVRAAEPAINPLIAFTQENYREIARVAVYLHGEAIVYRIIRPTTLEF